MAKASEPQSLLAPITAAIQQQAVFGVAFSMVGADENAVHFLGFQGTGADHLPLMPQNRYDLASLTKVVGTTTRLPTTHHRTAHVAPQRVTC